MNVLVVDDEAAIANLCRKVLSEAGHSVLVASTGSDAMALLDESEIDVVLSDIRMPGMSGVDLLRAIAPGGTHPDVVIMTGHASIASAVEAMRLGAYDYIVKPFSPDELIAILARIGEARALRAENQLLRFQLASEQGLGGMVGNSPAMLAVFEAILRVGPRRQPVLITGETGTGKELVARAIHAQGANPGAPFVPVDCGALPQGLVENELFGHVSGAFTGAEQPRTGLLASAGAGTLFLDEIGELPPDIQARLFRVLQEREFRPLGSDVTRQFQARVLAATDRSPEDAIEQGTFRPELYFRLNVHRIQLPPLRSRKDDIPALVQHFLRKHGEGRAVVVSSGAMEDIRGYDWPGNVRELENCVLHMLAASDDVTLDRSHLPRSVRNAVRLGGEAPSPLEQAERTTIQNALEASGGNVVEAARRLGVSKATLYRKLERYGVSRRTQ